MANFKNVTWHLWGKSTFLGDFNTPLPNMYHPQPCYWSLLFIVRIIYRPNVVLRDVYLKRRSFVRNSLNKRNDSLPPKLDQVFRFRSVSSDLVPLLWESRGPPLAASRCKGRVWKGRNLPEVNWSLSREASRGGTPWGEPEGRGVKPFGCEFGLSREPKEGEHPQSDSKTVK